MSLSYNQPYSMQDNLLNLIRLLPTSISAISENDWPALLKLSQEQAVMGVALQGIQKLPKEQWPPRKLLLQWISCVESIKWQNEKVNTALKSLVTELEAQGVRRVSGIRFHPDLFVWCDKGTTFFSFVVSFLR